MISNIQADVHRLYAITIIFYEGFEFPLIWESAGGPGTNPMQIQKMTLIGYKL